MHNLIDNEGQLVRCTRDELFVNFGEQTQTNWIADFFDKSPYKIPRALLSMLRLFQRGNAIPVFCYADAQKISIPYLLVNMQLNAFAVELALQLLSAEKKQSVLELINSEDFKDQMLLLPNEERVVAVFETVMARIRMEAGNITLFDSAENRIQNNLGFTVDLHGQLNFLCWYISDSQYNSPNAPQQALIDTYVQQLPNLDDAAYEPNSTEDYTVKLKSILQCLNKLYSGSLYTDQPPLLNIVETKKINALSRFSVDVVISPETPRNNHFALLLQSYLELEYYGALESPFPKIYEFGNNYFMQNISSNFDKMRNNCFLFDILDLTRQQAITIDDLTYQKEDFQVNDNRQQLDLLNDHVKYAIIERVYVLAQRVTCKNYILRRLHNLAQAQNPNLICQNVKMAFEWFGSAQIQTQSYFETIWESHLHQISGYLKNPCNPEAQRNLTVLQKKMLGYFYIKANYDFSKCMKTQIEELIQATHTSTPPDTSTSTLGEPGTSIQCLLEALRERKKNPRLSHTDYLAFQEKLNALHALSADMQQDLSSHCASMGNGALMFILCITVIGALLAIALNRWLPDQCLGRDAYRYRGKTFIFFQGKSQQYELDCNEAHNILESIKPTSPGVTVA